MSADESKSAASSGPARVGHVAPAWEGDAVVDGEFVTLSSTQFRGRYNILLFYPLDFTFVCPTELCAFNDRLAEFKALDCDVIACSVDSKFSHLAWTQQPRTKGGLGPMKLPLLSDITKSIAKAYGVLVTDGGDAGVALRGMFITSPTGVLRQATVNDLPVGRDVDEALRLVQAFKFTDEHGEVCPVGWRPGHKTMIDSPAESQAYFSSGATLPEANNKRGDAPAGVSDGAGATKRQRIAE